MSVHETDSRSSLSRQLSDNDIEQHIIADIRAMVLARKSMVTNKDIILELILKLETETDNAKLGVYRNALERTIQATPDDL